MPDGPQDVQNAPLNSNPMPAGMAPGAAPPPQQPQAAPQQNQAPPQQSELGRLALIGHAVGKLMGGSTTSYSVDPQTGQTIQTQQKMTPGQWGRSMVLGAMLGLAAGSGGDAKGGKAGGFLGGFGKGGAAVNQYNQQQDQLKRQQAQEQFQDQLKAQQNQREGQRFQSEQELLRAQIARENQETLRTQQLLKGGTIDLFVKQAQIGKAMVDVYDKAGIQPVARDKTPEQFQAITAGNPDAVAWDWEPTGVKTIITKDGTPDYVPTFSAYDPKDLNKPVQITDGFLKVLRDEHVDDFFPGTTTGLKAGQTIPTEAFSRLKERYQSVLNQNLEKEKAQGAIAEQSARIRELNAQADKFRQEYLTQQKNDKSATLLDAALINWNKNGGTEEVFQGLPAQDRMFIANNLLKQFDQVTKAIKEESAKTVPDEDEMNRLMSIRQNLEGYLVKAVPPPTAKDNPPDDVAAQLVAQNDNDPDKAKDAWKQLLKQAGGDSKKAAAMARAKPQTPANADGQPSVLNRLYGPSNQEGVAPPL